MTAPRTQPLRVLLVSHYYPPHLGGIENVVRNEAVQLAALGVDVTVLTSGERSGAVDEAGVRVVRVRAWNGVERRAGVPFPVLSPRLLPTALRLVRRADVVHVHDCLYPTSWAAGLTAALTRTPHLVTQHVALVEHPSALVRGVQRAVYATAGRSLLRRARAVLTLNAGVAAFVGRYGARPARSHHLANGVDPVLFRPAASAGERRDARRSFGLPDDVPLVLFAGRLVPKKGYDLLLAAHAAEPEPGYELVFAGDGDSRALAGRTGVHHLGTLSAERLAELYRACEIFALPSAAEGFPLTVQEAMASGLAVLTSDDPGYAPYRLDPGLVALVPRQVPALRTALASLAGDPELRGRMGDYARHYAETGFSWPQHAEALLRHYAEALPDRSPHHPSPRPPRP